MRSTILVAVVLGCGVCAARGDQTWTETFDDGVGRFDITTGDGNAVFVHDAPNASLNATFIRRDLENIFVPDRRLAELDLTVTEDSSVSFTFDWTPLDASPEWPSDTAAFLGFFDGETNELVMGAWILKAEDPVSTYRIIAPGFDSDFHFATWEFGHTYRVEFAIDGPGGTGAFSTWVLQDDEFVLQDSGEWPLPDSVDYSFGRLGMQNLLDEDFGSTLVIDIDNFSFRLIACDGDVNGDGTVDPMDSGFILARFGCDYPDDGINCLAADANGDGIVDPLDVGYVLARFGTCE